jgi:hypothetical protein
MAVVFIQLCKYRHSMLCPSVYLLHARFYVFYNYEVNDPQNSFARLMAN